MYMKSSLITNRFIKFKLLEAHENALAGWPKYDRLVKANKSVRTLSGMLLFSIRRNFEQSWEYLGWEDEHVKRNCLNNFDSLNWSVTCNPLAKINFKCYLDVVFKQFKMDYLVMETISFLKKEE